MDLDCLKSKPFNYKQMADVDTGIIWGNVLGPISVISPIV